jgi:hypothetical protein
MIDTHLCHPTYCPSLTSKALIIMAKNQIASAWWEEVINYYVKLSVSDLFIKESSFNGKGFKND